MSLPYGGIRNCKAVHPHRISQLRGWLPVYANTKIATFEMTRDGAFIAFTGAPLRILISSEALPPFVISNEAHRDMQYNVST